jgi:hypothetical protein
MTAVVLPEVDRSTIDDLRKRLPNLREIELPNLKELDLSGLKELELPKMESVGRNADAAVNKLLGRSRRPVWPWLAAGLGLAAAAGIIGAYFAWFRRPAWEATTTGTTASEPFAPSDPLDAREALDISADPGSDSSTPKSAADSTSYGTPLQEA